MGNTRSSTTSNPNDHVLINIFTVGVTQAAVNEAGRETTVMGVDDVGAWAVLRGLGLRHKLKEDDFSRGEPERVEPEQYMFVCLFDCKR